MLSSINKNLTRTPTRASILSSLLNSCIARSATNPGKQVHAQLILSGLSRNPFSATKLITLYSASHSTSNARAVFDGIPNRDRNVFVYNAMIRAYAWHGPHEHAISLFQTMVENGLEPDNFTYPFALKACSTLSAFKDGKGIHERAVMSCWDSDPFVGAALVDMYSKCGSVDGARDAFDRVTDRDVVVWNSMIAAYAHNGLPTEAFEILREMSTRGFRPTVATLVTTIATAADAAMLPQGREIHGHGVRMGFISQDKVNTALVDMYAKSGRLGVARTVFERLKERRNVSWNAIITGYAMHGNAEEALNLFDRMRSERFEPDHITYVGVLAACSRGGLLELGKKHFDSMKGDHSIEPTVQHYTCMVDLLAHAGQLREAYDLINSMPMSPDSGVWCALLNACKIHKDVEMGECVLKKLIELEPDDAGNYVILSNIYAQAGKWDEVSDLRRSIAEKGIKKTIACSWIEVKNQVHSFLVGDAMHAQSKAIYAELDRLEGLMRDAGYVPDTEPVFHDVEDDEKAGLVRAHSERLAIAFGIISTPPGTRLLVNKNLRVCGDCHVAIKLISKIVGREIVIRDINRYHRFKDGECSCGDYW